MLVAVAVALPLLILPRNIRPEGPTAPMAKENTDTSSAAVPDGGTAVLVVDIQNPPEMTSERCYS